MLSRVSSEAFPIAGELSLGEVYRQDLVTGVELAAFKHPESVKGIELHAPFVCDEGLWRPVIANSSNLTVERECRVSLSPHAVYGPEINLHAAGDTIGRPILGLDNKGDFEGDFGDNGCNEAFTEFSLAVSTIGVAVFQGALKDETKKTPLNYVTSREMYKFGIAVLDGINRHQSKIAN